MFLQTFNVALEQLRQDAVGRELMENAAEELLGYASHVPRYQHAAHTDGRIPLRPTPLNARTAQV